MTNKSRDRMRHLIWHARLQFSAAADVEPLWQRIADGTLRAVSIGYRVHRYDQRPDPASGEMIYRAVD